VPFSQLFAIFGYTIFVLIVVPIVIEFAVRAGYWAYRVFRPAADYSGEQRSDVYKNTPWAREFWNEEVSRATTTGAIAMNPSDSGEYELGMGST
jgi:hypothetical protein